MGGGQVESVPLVDVTPDDPLPDARLLCRDVFHRGAGIRSNESAGRVVEMHGRADAVPDQALMRIVNGKGNGALLQRNVEPGRVRKGDNPSADQATHRSSGRSELA